MNKNFKRNYPKTAKAIQIGGKVARVASMAYKTAMTVASLVNAEYKYYGVYFNNAVTSAGTITLLTGIDQGTTDITRTGDSVMMKYNYLKGVVIRNNNESAPEVQHNRIMIIRDMNDNGGTAPTLAQILSNTASTAGCYSHHNKDNTERFRVLYDKSFTLSEQNPAKVIKFYKEFKVKNNQYGKPHSPHCTWDDGTGTNTGRGHLYLVKLSGDATYGTNFIIMNRFGFIDN